MDNAIFPNKFKAALAAHQVQIGCWCALANPISTEVLGLAVVVSAGAGSTATSLSAQNSSSDNGLLTQ